MFFEYLCIIFRCERFNDKFDPEMIGDGFPHLVCRDDLHTLRRNIGMAQKHRYDALSNSSAPEHQKPSGKNCLGIKFFCSPTTRRDRFIRTMFFCLGFLCHTFIV